MKKVKIFFTILFSCCLLFSYFPISYSNDSSKLNISSVNDINYNFDVNTPYDNDWDDNRSIFNLRHNNIISNDFNGSYSFENDSLYYSDLISYVDIDSSSGSGSVNYTELIGNHGSVLNLSETGSGGYLIKNFVSNQTSGTIEFWFRTNDATDNQYFQFRDGSTQGVFLGVWSDNFQYYDTGWNIIKTCLDNIWYHIRIDFECGVGGYLGLPNDDFYITIDGVRYGNYNFRNAITELNNIILSSNTANSFEEYIDAIGYSWLSNYTIGNNIEPDIINVSSNILSNDRYEFMLDSTTTPYQDFSSDDFYGWDETHGSIWVVYDDDEYRNSDYANGGIEISGFPSVNTGIYNDTLNIGGSDINITFSVQFDTITGSGDTFSLFIEALDGTQILELQFEVNVVSTSIDLNYDDGVGYTNLKTLTSISNNDIHEFNLVLNNDFTIDLVHYLNENYESKHTFDFIDDCLGIDTIAFYVMETVGSFVCRLNYVGIYQYNISLSLEYGYLSYYYGNTWDSDLHNLLDFYGLDILKIGVINTHRRQHGDNYFEFRDYAYGSYFDNLYNENEYRGNCSIVVHTKRWLNLLYLNFTLEGVVMIEGSNTYYPNYNYVSTNADTSYFYISNNRLYHTFYIDNSGTYESMSISFNVNNQVLTNRSIIFTSVDNDIGQAYLNLTYFDTDNHLLEYRHYIYTRNLILPQSYVLDTFEIVINDLNTSSYNNMTNNGWIGNLELSYVPDIDLTITTISMLAMIIPLIVILIPTISISGVFGKRMLLPFFLFMSLVAFITGLIPSWLFVVIIISIGMLVLTERRGGNSSVL